MFRDLVSRSYVRCELWSPQLFLLVSLSIGGGGVKTEATAFYGYCKGRVVIIIYSIIVNYIGLCGVGFAEFLLWGEKV